MSNLTKLWSWQVCSRDEEQQCRHGKTRDVCITIKARLHHIHQGPSRQPPPPPPTPRQPPWTTTTKSSHDLVATRKPKPSSTNGCNPEMGAHPGSTGDARPCSPCCHEPEKPGAPPWWDRGVPAVGSRVKETSQAPPTPGTKTKGPVPFVASGSNTGLWYHVWSWCWGEYDVNSENFNIHVGARALSDVPVI